MGLERLARELTYTLEAWGMVYRWGPPGWPAGIGPKPSPLLPAAPAPARSSRPLLPARAQSVLIRRLALTQPRSPALSPASGALPRGVACRMGLKPAL